MTVKRLRNAKFGTDKLHVVVTGWAFYVAPTLIELMGLKQPEEMTGHSLLIKK